MNTWVPAIQNQTWSDSMDDLSYRNISSEFSMIHGQLIDFLEILYVKIYWQPWDPEVSPQVFTINPITQYSMQKLGLQIFVLATAF